MQAWVKPSVIAGAVLSILLIDVGGGVSQFTGAVALADEAIADEALASVIAAQTERIDAIAQAKKSAVSVFVPSGAGGGSGVVIDPEGYALTNFHVSSPAGAYMVCGMADGHLYDTVIVGIDPVGDLALVKLLGRKKFPAAALGNSDRVEQGDWCMVIGNPFLLANDLQPTVTWGIISGVHRYQYPSGTLLEYADCLQTDASINPGNSGGPIYDAQSRLIGIVGRASFEKRGRVNVGVGYAISINQAKNFLGYLHSGRIVDHATLGATVTSDSGKAIVSNILESSDAYRRGLRYGDEILELNHRTIHSANTLQNTLGTLPKGWRVPISFRSQGRTVDTIVRLAGVHGQDELIEKMDQAMPPPPPAPAPKESDDQEHGPHNDGSLPHDIPQKLPQKLPLKLPDGMPEEMPHKTKRDADAEPDIPADVAKVYEARYGYANYYFNRQHQQRLFKALVDQSPAAGWAWTVACSTDKDGPAMEFMIGQGVQIARDGGKIEAASTDDLYAAVNEHKLDAIGLCLDVWRRMIETGIDEFGSVYYLGTMPLRGEYPLRDVLVGTSGEIESWFYFHPKTGQLEAIECWADRYSDPAEMLIHPDGQGHPSALSLYYGDKIMHRLTVNTWKANDDAK